MGGWAATGRPMAEFWSLTPRLVMMVINEYMKRRNDEIELHSNLAAYQSWRTAILTRAKKIPRKPDDLMKTRKRKKKNGHQQDWKDQKAAFEMINAAMGGFDDRKKEG